jgi:hypothetical protein
MAIAIPTPIPIPTPEATQLRPAVQGGQKPSLAGVVDYFSVTITSPKYKPLRISTFRFAIFAAVPTLAAVS